METFKLFFIGVLVMGYIVFMSIQLMYLLWKEKPLTKSIFQFCVLGGILVILTLLTNPMP